jgi:hypothetical protein
MTIDSAIWVYYLWQLFNEMGQRGNLQQPKENQMETGARRKRASDGHTINLLILFCIFIVALARAHYYLWQL